MAGLRGLERIDMDTHPAGHGSTHGQIREREMEWTVGFGGVPMSQPASQPIRGGENRSYVGSFSPWGTGSSGKGATGYAV
jgi:hypothetical protein